MADLRIDIDGRALDLFEGEDDNFYITRQIHDLANLETRNSDFTKIIKVPATAKNLDLLQIDSLFDTSEAISIEAIKCNIILDGVAVANDADLFPGDTVNDNVIEVGIFYGNFAFFSLLTGNIRELDLTDHSFEFDLKSIVGLTLVQGEANETLAEIEFTLNVAPTVPLQVGDRIVVRSDGGNANQSPNGTITNIALPVYQANIPWNDALDPPPVPIDIWIPRQPANRDLTAQTSDVVYAFSDWFNVFDAARTGAGSYFRAKQDIELAGFWYYCFSLLEEIASEVGFTIDRSDIPTGIYDTLALNCAMPLFVNQESNATLGKQRSDAQSQAQAIDLGDVTTRVSFDEEMVITPDAVWSDITDDFTWTGISAPAFFKLNSSVTVLFASASGSVEVRLFQNLVLLASRTFITTSGTVNVSLSASTVAQLNDTFYVEIFATDGPGSNNGNITMNIGSIIDLGKEGGEVNKTISNPAIFLPSISKRNYVKGFLAMLNVVIATDGISKTIKLSKFDNISTKAEQTLKVDISKDFERTTILRNYFQNSEFKYLDEGLSLLRQDVNAIFNIADERLLLDGVVLQLPFEACDNSFLYDNAPDPVAVSATFGFSFDTAPGTNYSWLQNTSSGIKGAEDPLKLGDYIGTDTEIHRVTNVLSDTNFTIAGEWQVENTGGQFTISRATVLFSGDRSKIAKIIPNQATNWLCDGFLDLTKADPVFSTEQSGIPTNGLEAAFTNDLLWQNLITAEYTELLTALSRPLVVRLFVILTPAEFATIDFLRPVYLKAPFNGEYYINKIDQYKAGKPVRVELVRISEF